MDSTDWILVLGIVLVALFCLGGFLISIGVL